MTEARTIQTILKKAGIRGNSGDYRDYEKAKRIVLRREYIEPETYDRYIAIIKEWVRV